MKFVETDEAKLLEYAILELQKVASVEDDDKERIYTDSLACLRQCGGNEVKLSLIQAIFFSISSWCIGKLQDYHLHFSQVNCFSLVIHTPNYFLFLLLKHSLSKSMYGNMTTDSFSIWLVIILKFLSFKSTLAVLYKFLFNIGLFLTIIFLIMILLFRNLVTLRG